MSSIFRYTLEDSGGDEDLAEYENYDEAVTRAKREHLKVICNEYEWTDSYPVGDFTEDE